MLTLGAMLLVSTLIIIIAWRFRAQDPRDHLVIRVSSVSATLFGTDPPPPYDTVVDPPPSYDSVVSLLHLDKPVTSHLSQQQRF